MQLPIFLLLLSAVIGLLTHLLWTDPCEALSDEVLAQIEADDAGHGWEDWPSEVLFFGLLAASLSGLWHVAGWLTTSVGPCT